MKTLLVNELRIGNYIDPEYKAIVVGIYKDEWVTIKNNRTESDKRPIDCKPIPLTEQWLKDFGFIISDDYDLIMKNPFYAEGDSEYGYYLRWGYGGRYASENPCKYVHQLQNLYFALTGKELTK